MKKKLAIIFFTFVTCLMLYCSCSTSTYMGRWMKWRASDIGDINKFPSYPFKASQTPFFFVESYDRRIDTLKVTEKKGSKSSLFDVLENSGTTAFLVIRKDTIIYEKYLSGYNKESINTSFSVAKSISSLIVGKAIDDGIIGSENDYVTKYVPELLQTDEKYIQLKVTHLLDMKSGVQFKDHDLPWGDKPKAYYHPHLRDRVRELPISFEPGSKFQYNSYNPILVGMILENASGMSVAKYFEETIWDELGMEFSGSWSMDSEESGMTKMESGINIRAIDFAKFGRLVLRKGNWNGKQIISEKWMNQIHAITPGQNVKDIGKEIYYKNFWWIYSRDQKNAYIISGWGHLGQFLYVFPKEKIVIVRTGKQIGDVQSWGMIFKELVASIDSLEYD